MKQINKISDYLTSMTVKEMEAILHDIDNLLIGQQIIYVVDTFDIIEYTIPFFDSKKYHSNQNSFKFQNAIIYDSVFGNDSKIKFCLFKEYRMELLSIRNQISFRSSDYNELKETVIDRLRNKTIDLNIENFSDILNILDKNLELIVFLSVLHESQYNLYDKFIKFLTSKIDLFDISKDNEGNTKNLNILLNTTESTDFAKKVYNEFVEKIIGYLAGLVDDMDRYSYLENSYRDICVIERTLLINNELEKNKSNIKLHYLSSASSKTNEIFSIINNFDINKNTSINRTIFQVFLLNILISNLDLSIAKEFINSLIAIKKSLNISNSGSKFVLRQNLETINSTDNNISTTLKLLDNILSNTENQINNSFIYSIYKSKKQNFSNIIKNLKSSEKINDQNLVHFLDEVSEYFNTSEYHMNFQDTIFHFENLRVNKVVSNKVKILHNISKEKFVPLGKDVIKNSFHHLPFLIFADTEITNLSSSLYSFFDQLTNDPTNKELTSPRYKKLVLNIVKSLSHLNKRNLFDYMVEYITLNFVNLLTPGPIFSLPTDSKTYIESKEDIILNRFENQKLIIKKSKVRYGKFEGTYSILKASFLGSEIITELDYFLVWIYRRQLKFDEAIELSTYYIDNEELNEGQKYRFYHGRGLANCSKAYDLLHNNKAIHDINLYFNKSMNDLLLVLSHIDNKIDNLNLSNPLLNLFVKTKVGILNNIIDSKIRVMEIIDCFSHKELSECRKLLKILKKDLDLITTNENNFYSNFPTINHTEAELEYYEAKDLFSRNLFYEAKLKIEEALKRSYNFDKKNDIIAPNFRKIYNKIFLFYNEIEDYTNYID